MLAVLPTGSGKSMTYVLPALISGRVLVVSPHIALMQDQVESLVANGIAAAFINSNLTNSEKRNTYIAFRDGALDLLYTSPESLANQRFVTGLACAGINLLAIDEAHCVSEWGHTFRPDYLRLDSVRKQLGSPRTIALTATATSLARDDIARRLGLDHAVRVVHSVDRPNLTFAVNFGGGNSEKQDFLLDYCGKRRGKSGIVYVGSRKRTEELAELLSGADLNAAHYHAGMGAKDRSEVQRRFMTDRVDVMVATNAFGLGVDKPDVRFIVHHDMPARLEAYYQESGRAGRDGEPAECVLIYTPYSAAGPRRFIDRDHPPASELRMAWRRLCAGVGPGSRMPESRLGRFDGEVMAVRAFQESGLLDSAADFLLSDNPDAVIDSTVVDRHREHEFEMLERMLGYAQTLGCRRNYILEYFGEKSATDRALPSESFGCDPTWPGRIVWTRLTCLRIGPHGRSRTPGPGPRLNFWRSGASVPCGHDVSESNCWQRLGTGRRSTPTPLPGRPLAPLAKTLLTIHAGPTTPTYHCSMCSVSGARPGRRKKVFRPMSCSGTGPFQLLQRRDRRTWTSCSPCSALAPQNVIASGKRFWRPSPISSRSPMRPRRLFRAIDGKWTPNRRVGVMPYAPTIWSNT